MKRRVAIILSLAISACSVPPPKPTAAPVVPAPGGAVPTPAPATPPAGSRYRIDAAASELEVLVYRAGPMASLGHNHVISAHSIEGWATFDGNPAAASFAVSVPVTDFAVDEPALRAKEGPDFAEPVDDDARVGTSHNMLGPSVLNAANFSALEIRSVSLASVEGAWQARVSLDVAGHRSTLVVPFTLEVSPHRLVAAGELTVSQSTLGLTPFSVFLGALKVQDDLRVKFRFVAVKGA